MKCRREGGEDREQKRRGAFLDSEASPACCKNRPYWPRESKEFKFPANHALTVEWSCELITTTTSRIAQYANLAGNLNSNKTGFFSVV